MQFFVLGSEDVITGFQFIGIRGAVVNNKEEALKEFNNVVNSIYGEIGILIVTEKVALLIDEELIEWQLSGNYPLIVEIPDLDGHIEERKSLIEIVRDAIGIPV